MASFLKESDLKKYSLSTASIIEAKTHITKYKFEAVKTIFLSHSHEDRELAEGLVNLLAGVGIKLYVDWQDSSLPRVTNRRTAEEIKKKIQDLDFFLILATNRALKSRWVPWETGVADQCKTPARMAIIPVVDNSGIFEKNEYLQLYNRLEIDYKGALLLYEIGSSYSSKELKEWIKA